MSYAKKIEVQIVNAFVYKGQGGNPAGVVINAEDLSENEKIKIASEVGLSETAFVSKSTIADFKLEFFTPSKQIAHCGHATVATFSYLLQLGLITSSKSSKETIDGTREILLKDEMAFMQQRKPVYKEFGAALEKQILKSLRLENKDIVDGAPILSVDTGNPFAVVAVKNAQILKNIQPDFGLISEISSNLDMTGYYVYCLETNTPQADASARMFAPHYGIDEEAATGMGAGTLACYLYDVIKLNKNKIFIEQGWFMKPPSPSLVIVDLALDANNKISSLMAGGKGMVIKKLLVEL